MNKHAVVLENATKYNMNQFVQYMRGASQIGDKPYRWQVNSVTVNTWWRQIGDRCQSVRWQ